MDNENILLNPDEIKKRRRSAQESTFTQPTEKVYNRSGKITIEYETKGRFNNPKILYFNDYTVEDITDLTMGKQEQLLETTVAILNKNMNEDANCNIEDFLIEELIETLIGLKVYTNESPIHMHPWVDECQYHLPASDQQVNETEINLLELKYTSIDEADQNFRNYLKEQFESLTKEEWLEYTKEKYTNHDIIDPETLTIEEEIKNFKIKEPITIATDKGEKYQFRFVRVKDFLKAQQMMDKKYNPLFKAAKNKKYPGLPLTETKLLQEKETENLHIKQAKEITLCTRALTLLSVNGKELTPEESLEIYRKLPMSILKQYLTFMNNLEFGLNDKKEFTCPLCGEVRVRYLQQGIIPFEFLPLDDDTKREQTKSKRIKIYFGV